MEHTYDLIALDMDGTLLRSDKTISRRTLEAIERARMCGKAVCLATGRPLSEIRPYQDELSGIRYCMLESGALLWDNKEQRVLARRTLPRDCYGRILEASLQEDMMVQAMSLGRSIVTGNEIGWMEHWHMGVYQSLYRDAALRVPDARAWIRDCRDGIEKINLYHISRQASMRTAERLSDLPIERTYAETSSLELSPEGVDKGSGLLDLCRVLGIPAASAIAVGDADNDLPMIREAGLGIAMGNANDHVLETAQVIVGTNDADGCAEAIDRFLLGE